MIEYISIIQYKYIEMFYTAKITVSLEGLIEILHI